MEKYEPTIGLEIHAELATKSKMFCSCENDPDEKEPNLNICPVCMGHPGTLPVINFEAIRQVLRLGQAVGGKLADFTEFDRKNYFYPDIPKGYQISQYKYPLISGGSILNIQLRRIHLEEDTARSQHDRGDFSLVDYNRAGVPLMELVTEPELKSAKQTADFARELQLLLWYLGASEANLEKGEMRVEANISVAEKGSKEFGTKVEIKNLNSFKAVEKAIDFEIKRHIEILEEGGKIIQETRGWDEKKGETFGQRQKEDSDDYRYFPEPDLPKIYLSEVPEFAPEKIRENLPELPWEKRDRYLSFGFKKDQVEFLVGSPHFSDWFDGVLNNLVSLEEKQLAANYAVADLVAICKKENKETPPISGTYFSKIIKMILEGKISSKVAKDLLLNLMIEDRDPEDVAKEKNLIQTSDQEGIRTIVKKIISENLKVADEFKAGKETSLQFLVGQVMKESRGSANPTIVQNLLREELK